ncbi:MAG: hypothetical protein R3E32_19470 [Chitinophagales bacterium]
MLTFLQSQQDILFYLLIPIISALVGWGTNVLALKMTFYPTEFWGIPPSLGWQGIIPSKAGVMAEKAVDLMTSKLIDIQEMFARMNPDQVIEEIGPELQRINETIIEEVMRSQLNMAWKLVPSLVKKQIYQQAAAEMPFYVKEFMEEMKVHIKELFDVKQMVVASLTRDKDLLNNIFLKVGDKEFQFIERSGLFFGFLFGLLQMGICLYYNPPWMLPLAGVLVGFATNWLALKLIFEPLEPKKVGRWTLQGLFMKRQQQVATEYAAIITANILTVPNIFEAIQRGPAANQLTQLIQKYVDKAVDAVAGDIKETIQLSIGGKRYQVVKNIACWSMVQELPMIIGHVYEYAEEALDIENTLSSRMMALPPVEFQGFLRPVFQEDEAKLIAVGAFLGGLAGLMQAYFFF